MSSFNLFNDKEFLSDKLSIVDVKARDSQDRLYQKQLLRRVDVAQVQTYWGIGRHIVEFEQGGQNRATYGKQLLSRLAESLTHEFGKGFDERNLRNMRAFFSTFQIGTQCVPN